MKIIQIALVCVVVLLVAMPALMWLHGRLTNPGVEREIREDPTGERAAKVMLITLPSGRRLPVNYLREDGRVYAGADGRWWKELEGGLTPVSVFVAGESLEGRARAVRDDPAYAKDIFSRLRPKALPGFGTLVEVLLDPSDPGGPISGKRTR